MDAIFHPESKVKAAELVIRPIAAHFPAFPENTAHAVQVNGAVQVGAATLLALGRLPRLAALALIASLIPTTIAGHRFWDEIDEEVRAQQLTQFLKNLGLLGGLVLTVAQRETGAERLPAST
jgi:putative oxidoreductase